MNTETIELLGMSRLSKHEQVKLKLFFLPKKIMQYELAEKLNVSESLISLALSGKRKKILFKIESFVDKIYANLKKEEDKLKPSREILVGEQI